MPCMAQATARLSGFHEAFHLAGNLTLWRALQAMEKAGHGIGIIELWEWLKDHKLTEQTEGLAYLSGLPDKIPSSANIGYYLDIVFEKATLRQQLATFQHAIDRIYDFRGDFDELQFATLSDVSELLNKKTATVKEVWSIKSLINFDADKDPDALIGMRYGKATRFLCRGYGAFFIGPSGVGKSSWIMQAAVSFALGRDMCSIQPVKPLRVLVIQGENDQGDAAEMLQGVLNSFGLAEGLDDETLSLLSERIAIVTERRTTGQAFCDFLRDEIRAHQADVVFVDPFMSFAGIDVTRQDQCTKFLREQLNPVLHETKAVLIAAHHTGKPKDKKFQNKTALEYAYDGIGSSELVNWARAVLVLIQLEGPYFELKLAKRGFRAGAKHPDAADGEPGEFTTSIYLRHASDRIFWEQTVPPETKESEPKEKKLTIPERIARQINTSSFLSTCLATGETQREIVRRLRNWLTSKQCANKIDISEGTGRKAVAEMVANEKLSLTDNLYRKGDNA